MNTTINGPLNVTGHVTGGTSTSTNESQIIAQSDMGNIYLHSNGSNDNPGTPGHKGLYCYNSSGTGCSIIGVDDSNNLYLGGDLIVDQIYAQGVVENANGNFYYRKYTSGKMEMWRCMTCKDLAMTTAYGSMYYAETWSSIFDFVYINSVQSSAYHSTLTPLVSQYEWTFDDEKKIYTRIYFYVLNPVSATGTVYINIYIMGRWK